MKNQTQRAYTLHIYSRGNPDGPTLDGKELEAVHLMKDARKPGVTEPFPACYNGAYNLRWTDRKEKVTCPACLERIKNHTV